jgi:hypothetical protein
MTIHVARRATPRRSGSPARARPGFALGLALIFTLVIGALATAAIILSSNATLLAKSSEHQRDLKYAAEAALQLEKSRLDLNSGILPDSGETQVLTNATIQSADYVNLSGIKVNVWVGPSGAISGQYGNFATIVSQATDTKGISFVRRLDVVQESFAKYVYWSNTEGAIQFNNDQLWGPVWSNDVIRIGSGGVVFHDSVATAATISGASYGTFLKGYLENQRSVSLPTSTKLGKLSSYATTAGYNFTAPTTSDETNVLERIEFVATDLNADGDSLDDNEGFFRVYTANAGQQAWLRGDFPGGTSASAYTNCGDWHQVTPGGDLKFFPASVHNNLWFKNLLKAGGMSDAAASAEQTASVATIMQHAGARCFLGGDPHLVAVSRNIAPYGPADRNKGGDDTTFTPVGAYGSWAQYTATPNATVSAKRVDAKYLFPLSRTLNSKNKGVIYVGGSVGVSGTVRGRVTLYAHNGYIALFDDIRYAHDPSLNSCSDVAGLIADRDIVVSDNGINTPQDVNVGSSGHIYRSLDDSQDMYIQAVTMALNASFRVQNYGTGPTSALTCNGSYVGRGCLYVTGGLIQVTRGAVGTSGGTGYSKSYSYDACAASYPPPYFPTTGRFTDNRYYEVNPVGFNVVSLFQSISSGN